MTDAGNPNLSPETLLAVKDSRDRFEQLWRDGRRPTIEEHVAAVAPELRPALLDELIRIEIAWRCRAGESPARDEYVGRFAGRAAVVDECLARATAAVATRWGEGETRSTGGPGPLPTPADRPPEQPTPAALSPPKVLGEYELLEKLGGGGMGDVYKARHRRLDKLVAVKLLPPRPDHSPEAVARFLREMRAAGSVDHPNVIEAHDAGEHAGLVYLVMKLVEGTDLHRLARDRGPLSVGEACDLARQTALGLQHLAERGLVHRDIKPSNLMRTPSGTVVILDLGLARWRGDRPPEDDLTGVGQTLGTPDYLAPEQVVCAADVDIRADLYGLGGMLFYLLAGRAPFAHRTCLYSKLEAVRNEPPPDVRAVRPDAPADVAELVNQLLAKRPADRPQTPAEVAARLAGGPATSTVTDSAATRWSTVQQRGVSVNRFGRRRLAVVGVGLALALLAALWRFAGPREAAPPAPLAPTDAAAPPAATPPAPFRVVRLNVLHTANVDGKGVSRGVLGQKSFVARLGDGVEVEAELSRPGYAYVIAFRPDGKEDLCFPDSADRPPPRTDRPRFPWADQTKEYGLDDGAGLEVFAVVASDRPLPAYAEWRARRGATPWKHEASPPGVVWSYDGTEVQGLAAATETRGPREAAGKAAVVTLARWLKGDAGDVVVATVGFAVLPKD